MADAPLPDGSTLAALDLGSNSFHLVLARKIKGEISLLKRLGEKVQLAAGLDECGNLNEEAQLRGLECLKRMAPFVQGLNENQVRVVGTNALRAAHNSDDFISRAQDLLGLPIEVIAGREEARLIYSGVVHTSPKIEGRRLVIDIGGGSTEFIIGEGKEPELLESLHMGCVSYSQRFFPQGQFTEKGYQQARLAALSELLHIQKAFLGLGWQQVLGSSGTLKTLALVIGKGEFAPLTPQSLRSLEKDLFNSKSTQSWTAYGMKEDRARVMPAGLAIASAFFEALQIKEMHFADAALREGLLYELAGTSTELDIRDRTINSLQERFQCDPLQSKNVADTAIHALRQVASNWGLAHPRWENKLRWAAQVHELGLSVAHTQYHKHGAYLLNYADLAGFTRQQQQILAVLVRTHRRKFPSLEFRKFSPEHQLKLQRLARLLRLAVLLNHSRPDQTQLDFTLEVNNTNSQETLALRFPDGWLEQQPLLLTDLAQEASWQAAAGFELTYA
ncbi:exopolyphosphatase / guanosine-5'-triphosphate,3'-diphosphate pyrophosphatase [Marinospirillum celere]|uniref:Exopolyphosphatase / guanosine-5'-triphosphate,3'-diphosphate pyrophosphatase n=1 Tax=Marinospirillum celere TaxID=1122252 RepID=A0A1I1H5U2_9GAMM|nr:Ppx/GppA phosphatase family protein [Marinospirillum celere]SFC19126.1 exopolyphosphatase / guanosine-5'-triphosphate,3'-diphosphate pyrophosphatase [Marinospirillum celere]